MKKKAKIRLLVVVISIVLLIMFLHWQNNDIVISKYSIYVSEGNSENIKLKILQISDLHNKEFGENNKVLIDMVKSIEPDIIAITGDFIDSYKCDTEVALETAKALVEIAPVYFVTGNHERRVNEAIYLPFEENLAEIGVNVLFNTVVNYNDKINIIGIDDMSLSSDDKTLSLLMQDAGTDKISVLLAHEPQEFDWYAECGADVVLSGHAHGGQIRIPFTDIGLVAPGQGFFPKYSAGVYESGSSHMIVSRGLGNSIFPVRLFNRPELVEIDIY